MLAWLSAHARNFHVNLQMILVFVFYILNLLTSYMKLIIKQHYDATYFSVFFSRDLLCKKGVVNVGLRKNECFYNDIVWPIALTIFTVLSHIHWFV